MTIRFLAGALLITALSATYAHALDVNGTITDDLGAAVPGLKVVVVRERTLAPNIQYSPTYSDENGGYVKPINQQDLPASCNLHIKVNWHLELGANYGNRHIILEWRGGYDAAGDWYAGTPFTEKVSGSVPATPTSIATINAKMLQRQPSPAPAGGSNAGTTNIQRDILRTLDYVRSNKRQDTNWTIEHDIPIELHESDHPHDRSRQSQGTLRLHVRTHDTDEGGLKCCIARF